MNVEVLMEYVTYALIVIGVLAFLVSIITQVIKEMPGLKNIQTNAVALVVALILCPLAVVILCIYLQITIMWYYIVGSVIAAFIVYLVATGGWEKVAEMWSRTKYNKTK
ncbi:ribonuclease [Mordavella massiliensis]|uniref:Ribonuclease n=1 Tax=Mordavella massiliensis TaxID=1871024 RepID=A0A938XF27_9CLOT|nr:ribonuclease [Mordavella massiliensis]MBM6949519.1 ribonuclease [Mordavella massiliensis]